MQKTLYQRRMLITLLVMVLLAPVIVYGGMLAMRNMRTSPGFWVPESFTKRQEYNWFENQFETNDVILMSWDDCYLGDPRLNQLRQALLRHDETEEGQKLARWIERVYTGESLLEEMTSEPLDLDRDLARQRLEGSLIGKDGKTTCCVLLLTEVGVKERQKAIPVLLDVARRECEFSEQQLRVVGPPMDAYMIDTESVASMRMFVLPSALITLLLCRICMRSWPYTFLVFGIAVFGELLALALVYYSGETMNAVLIVLPPLVMVLTVSAAVHLVNYYHDEVRLHGLDEAPRKAMRNGRIPCFLATATTAIGLLSLAVSDIVPVRLFGIYATAGIVTTLALLFLTLPGAMERWPVPAWDEKRYSLGDLAPLANLTTRYSIPLMIFGLAILLGAGWGLNWMRTSVNVRSLFTADSKILRDYRWFEEHIGPMVPVEVVIRFDEKTKLDEMAQLEVVRDVQEQLEGIDHVDGTLSAASFFRPIPTRYAARKALAVRLRQSMDKFVDTNYLHLDGNRQAWRISGRVPAMGSIDYGKFLDQIESKIDPKLAQISMQDDVGKVSAVYTGVMPLAYEVQRVLLQDLIKSFLAAVVLVSIVMMFVLRSVIAGMLAMIPNVFPTVLLFGITSWRGVPIDIGSVMTASVALGIAVDDTLHFLSWFNREYSESGDRNAAVRLAFRHCAKAMAQTTLICGCGLCIYSLSWFIPTQRFAWMMVTLLLAALIGDLLLLPALLAGPLGRLFPRRTSALMAVATGTTATEHDAASNSSEEPEPAAVSLSRDRAGSTR